MIRPEGQPIVTAAGMRAAETASGASTDTLMLRAGTAIAAAVRRLAGANGVLILCGPGNNGGDGYVAAAVLRASGIAVRVAASEEPGTDAARVARARWSGPVETLVDAAPAPILVDALFGTGLTRAIAPQVGHHLHRLVGAATLAIAVDLPSGVATDDGSVLAKPPAFDLTLALGAAKPAHVLQPAARYCGDVRILDIGVSVPDTATILARPHLTGPGPDSHKYTRGMVAVVGGAMPGASELASLAAMRAGAGYALHLGVGDGPPHALVRKPFDTKALTDDRIGAIVIGPGLGRDDDAQARLDAALASGRPLVIDGDALRLVDPDSLARHAAPIVLTPHGGEFDHLFGSGDGGKIARACAAATRTRATIVYKGADTVIAAPDGRVRVARDASDWLSTAGTGDVLAGAIGAMLASGLDPLEAAAAGVWLHGDAARRLGPAFIADDLAAALTKARASA